MDDDDSSTCKGETADQEQPTCTMWRQVSEVLHAKHVRVMLLEVKGHQANPCSPSSIHMIHSERNSYKPIHICRHDT